MSKIKVAFNPEYAKKKENEGKTEHTVKSITRHEINHKGYKGFNGCPRTTENHAGKIMEPISTILESTPVATVLDEFVKNHQQIFMVEDKFGTIVGLITLEDAIETLLGVEIVDEHDSVIDMRKLAMERREKRLSAQKHSRLPK